ncbi:MAG: hypothetical protein IPI23_19340 [Bacteroidetes bacterium]|nr:hypothetical protein [Bacteroidota bacterium]
MSYTIRLKPKIKEIKTLINDTTTKLNEKQSERDGYYRNEKTYGSIIQQLDNLNAKIFELKNEIELKKNSLIL